MNKQSYYGENFEGMIITGMSLLIILALIGAWSLMSQPLHEECSAMTYTYCGPSAEKPHH